MMECPKCKIRLSTLKVLDTVITKQFTCYHCDTMLDLNGKNSLLRELSIEISIAIIVGVLVLFLDMTTAQVVALAFGGFVLYVFLKSRSLQGLFEKHSKSRGER